MFIRGGVGVLPCSRLLGWVGFGYIGTMSPNPNAGRGGVASLGVGWVFTER